MAAEGRFEEFYEAIESLASFADEANAARAGTSEQEAYSHMTVADWAVLLARFLGDVGTPKTQLALEGIASTALLALEQLKAGRLAETKFYDFANRDRDEDGEEG